MFGEDVREADVLRLALDGHLKLSVRFVNHASARRGKVVPIDEAETFEVTDHLSGGEPIQVIRGLHILRRDIRTRQRNRDPGWRLGLAHDRRRAA